MEMPILKAVPIKTKGKPLFKKVVIWLSESRRWELYKDWKYDTIIDGKKVSIVIKKGFVFDGASVPKPMRIFYSPVGLFLIAGLIHDYAYRFQRVDVVGESGEVKYSIGSPNQKEWDKLFRDVNIEVNDCSVSANIGYYILRTFGSFAWNKNRIRQNLCSGDESKLARSCQTNNLKQIQCDEYGYNYCERCGDIIDIELHHTLEISRHGKLAINSSGHILLCAGCHVKIHNGCKE